MRTCRIDQEILRGRRVNLGERIQGAAFILAAHPEFIRNRDVHHPYRQDSSLYYFTGFEEPESAMLFRPGRNPEFTLFVRKKDQLRETWDGFRFGPEGAEQHFGADKAFLIEDFEAKAAELLAEVDTIYYRMGLDSAFDKRVQSVSERVLASKGRGGGTLPTIVDPSGVIGELRLRKSSEEIELMRKAGSISARAHLAAMKYTRPGVSERQIDGVINYMFSMEGAAREGYRAIVATGANATTLHYNFNDQECKDGDLILIDAGAEYEYYSGDITRTYPVNGRFTEPQKVFYQKVLDVQKAIIDMAKPGTLFTNLQKKTVELLTQAMVDLGLLEGSVESLIENNAYKKYYPHGVSHWLGMDVHDVGSVQVNGEPRKLEEGMVFTVEPGLYVPLDDETAPEDYRGMGVRIEDDILITSSGYENLTSGVPKEIAEMEDIIGTAPAI